MIVDAIKGLGSFGLVDETGEIFTWFYRDINQVKLKMKSYEAKGILAIYSVHDGVKFYEFHTLPSLTASIREIVLRVTENKEGMRPCDKSQIKQLREWGVPV